MARSRLDAKPNTPLTYAPNKSAVPGTTPHAPSTTEPTTPPPGVGSDSPDAVLKPIGDRVRERRLGGDARAGRRVRGEVRRMQWAFVRRNIRFLASGVALGGLATAVAGWLAPNDFLSGSAITRAP